MSSSCSARPRCGDAADDPQPLPAVRVLPPAACRRSRRCCTASPPPRASRSTPAAVALVARAARGSFRDAVSALDQLATACSGPIGVDDVRALLGTTDDGDALRRSTGSPPATPPAACGRRRAGRRRRRPRDAGHRPARPPAADLPPAAAGRAAGRRGPHRRRAGPHGEQAERLEPAAVHRLIDLLRDVLDEVREGADPRLPLELALVRVCRPAGELSVEAFEQRLSRLEAAMQGARAATAVGRPGAPTADRAKHPPRRQRPPRQHRPRQHPPFRARRRGRAARLEHRPPGRPLARRGRSRDRPALGRARLADRAGRPRGRVRRRRPRLPQVPALCQGRRRHPAEPRAPRVGARAGGRRAGASAHGGG